MRLAHRLQIPAFILALLALVGCNGLAGAYCELGAECDDDFGFLLDPVPGNSDDSAAVCAVNQQTFVDSLRANSEDVCQEAAAAWEVWMACAVEEGCAAFELGEDECKDELDDYADLIDEAGNRCNE